MISKSTVQLISIALMVAGIALVYWGYELSGGFESQLNQAFSGSGSDDVMIRYIAGATSFAVGLFMFLKK